MKTEHQKRIEEFMKLAGQSVPEKPIMPDIDTRKLRAKLILEEALETIEGLGFDLDTNPSIGDSRYHFYSNGLKLVDNGNPSLESIADGCADISVVTIGTLSACGISDKNILEMVDNNNLAKFGPGGYRRDDGKWVKPPDHRPPDIAGELEKQSK